MDAKFDCSWLVATLGLSSFLVGTGLSAPWSPLAELYGRRPIYIASFGLFVVWLVPTAVARNIGTVIVSCFFAGITGSAFLSVCGGTVGDLFAPADMTAPMALVAIGGFVGSSAV